MLKLSRSVITSVVVTRVTKAELFIIRPIYECRCDERLKIKDEGSTRLIHWVVRGTGTPKDKDEVNRRDICECDG